MQNPVSTPPLTYDILAHVIYDRAFCEQCPDLRADDFRSSGQEWSLLYQIARQAIEFFRANQEPMGNLVGAEMMKWFPPLPR